MRTAQKESDAILIHSRKFQETSLLCTFFTKDHGKISVIARVARRKKSKFQSIAVPGAIFRITFSGKNDLKTLISCETLKTIDVKGQNLKIYLYLNEIILKTLEAEEPIADIYDDLISIFEYLNFCSEKDAIELKLRHFEYELISELGYGFNIKEDIDWNLIDEDSIYSFNPQLGFTKVERRNNILGLDLIKYNKNLFEDQQTRASIKFIMRSALENIIEKPLASKEIFK